MRPLSNRTSRGLSNELLDEEATVAVESGTLYSLLPVIRIRARYNTDSSHLFIPGSLQPRRVRGQAERKRRCTLRPDEPDMGNANEGSSMTQISAAARGNPASVTQIDYARAGHRDAGQMRTVAAKEGA